MSEISKNFRSALLEMLDNFSASHAISATTEEYCLFLHCVGDISREMLQQISNFYPKQQSKVARSLKARNLEQQLASIMQIVYPLISKDVQQLLIRIQFSASALRCVIIADV